MFWFLSVGLGPKYFLKMNIIVNIIAIMALLTLLKM